MKKLSLLLICVFIFLLTVNAQEQNSEKNSKNNLAPIEPVEEIVCGDQKIVDEYRYMENVKDERSLKWMKEQSDKAQKVLETIPGRKRLLVKMEELDKRKGDNTWGIKITDNDKYFYLKMSSDEQIPKLYFRNKFAGKEELLFDSAAYKKESGGKFVISNIYPEMKKGDMVAVEVFSKGAENSEIVIINTKTKKRLADNFSTYGACSWLPDGKGFLYRKVMSSDIHKKDRYFDHRIMYHALGKNPETDVSVFHKQDADLSLQPDDVLSVIYDPPTDLLFAVAEKVNGDLKMFYSKNPKKNIEEIKWKEFISVEEKLRDFKTTSEFIYIISSKDASGFKIIRKSVADLEKATMEDVVTEDKNGGIIDNFFVTKDALYYVLTKNGVKASLFKVDHGSKKPVEITNLPLQACTIILSGKDSRFNELWVYMSGWTSPFQRHRFSHQKNNFILEMLHKTPEYPEYRDFVVEEIMIPSHDGVMIPLSLVYKKGMEKNGKIPVLIDGYGSYGISIKPTFYTNQLLWVAEGGIMAIAHVRGGGELGEKWHKAGQKLTKPNTWKDLIASAEYLIKNNYTQPKHIAITGGSAGGILVGRAMTERPDLFSAVIPDVGDLNMLRAEENPNGQMNIAEFGTIKKIEECKALMEMDSYLNLKKGVSYPATLILTGFNDPRVPFWHSGKFAAKLMAYNKSQNPQLLLVDYESGHGHGDTKHQGWDKMSNIMSFGLWRTGHPDYQIKHKIVGKLAQGAANYDRVFGSDGLGTETSKNIGSQYVLI